MVFSSCSRKDLENSLEKGVGMCLFNLPEVKESFGGQKCGNGYVEDGEECDCGEPDVRNCCSPPAHRFLTGKTNQNCFDAFNAIWCKTKLSIASVLTA